MNPLCALVNWSSDRSCSILACSVAELYLVGSSMAEMSPDSLRVRKGAGVTAASPSRKVWC